MNTKTKTDAIVAMAEQPDGVLCSGVCAAFNLNDRAASSYLSRLTIAGRLFVVRIDGQRNRWFAKAEHATAWQESAPKRQPLRDRTLALLQEVAGAGLVPKNVQTQLHTSTALAKKTLEELTTEGAAHRGLRAGFGYRYFATRRLRDSWNLNVRNVDNHTTMFPKGRGPVLAAVDQKIKSTAPNSQGPAINLPGSLKAPAVRAQHKAYQPKPITYEKAAGYTHDDRYQVDPNKEFPSIFRSLPLGATLKGVQA